MIAEIIINRSAKKLNRTFDYNIPQELEELVMIGSTVLVPFGKTAKGKEAKDIDMIKNKIGMNIMLKLGSKLHEVRDELIKFVAVYKEISEEEAAKVDMIEVIKDLILDEDFTSFLKRMAVPKQKK